MRAYSVVIGLTAAVLLTASAQAEGLVRPSQSRPRAAADGLPVAGGASTSAAQLGLAMRAAEHSSVTPAALTITEGRPSKPAHNSAHARPGLPTPGGR